MRKILCGGGVTVDVMIIPLEKLPEPGKLSTVNSIQMHLGGCAINVSIALRKIGMPVKLVCRVGDDQFGEYIIEGVSANAINTNEIVIDPTTQTTVSVVCIQKDGQRSFIYMPGSTAKLTKEDFNLDELSEGDILFITSALLLDEFDGQPCSELLKEAKRRNIITAMDTSWDSSGVWLSKIIQSLPYLDLFMPSYDEASLLSQKKDLSSIADTFKGYGVKNIIIKLGNNGAYFYEDNGDRYIIPTYNDISVVDTTGAGDSFCAGILYGIAHDWSFEQSGRFANAVASHCVKNIGATTGIPTRSDIFRFMEENSFLNRVEDVQYIQS